MSCNIEIKARCTDLQEFYKKIGRLDGIRYEGKQKQSDTFFVVPRGRLKLRRITGSDSYLIPYLRSDTREPKSSEYVLLPAQDAETTETLLTEILGVKECVEKERDIYHYRNVRIHIDQVRGLGNFIEFEAVVNDPGNTGGDRKKVDMLLDYFSIDRDDLIAESYIDMISETHI